MDISSLRPPRPSDPGDRGLRNSIPIVWAGFGLTLFGSLLLWGNSQSGFDAGAPTYTVHPTEEKIAEWLFCSSALWIVAVVVLVRILRTRSRKAAIDPARNPSRWERDPTGRHEFRYWSGTQWTANVADRGVASEDPFLPAHQP